MIDPLRLPHWVDQLCIDLSHADQYLDFFRSTGIELDELADSERSTAARRPKEVKSLKPSEIAAFTAYNWAKTNKAKDPVAPNTDKEVFAYIQVHRKSCPNYPDLPKQFETFARYVRSARNVYRQQKRPRRHS